MSEEEGDTPSHCPEPSHDGQPLVSHTMDLQSAIGNAGTTADIQRQTGSGTTSTLLRPR